MVASGRKKRGRPRRGSGNPAPKKLIDRRKQTLIIIACAFIFLATQAYQMVSVFDGLSVDDAYISYRYAENLAQGSGLVWNVGDRIEGYSNFLWVLTLTPIALFVDDLALPAHLLGFTFAAFVLWLTFLSLRRLGVESLWRQALALLLVASSGYFSAWSVSGMETACHAALLLSACLWLTDHKDDQAPPAKAALPLVALALLRPEGLFVALGGLAYHLFCCKGPHKIAVRDKRFWLLPLLVVAPLLAYHLFRFGYYGPFLFPNSVRAKVGLSLPQAERGFAHWTTNFLVPYAPLLLCAILLFLRRLRSRPAVVCTSLFLGYLLFTILSGGDWSFGRFYAPLLPLGVVVFVAALDGLHDVAAPLRKRWAQIGLVTALVIYSIWAWRVTGVEREYVFRERFVEKDSERVAIGRWLAREAPDDAVVAVFAAGQIPYYSKLRAHDMLGLNDGHIVDVEPRPLGEGALAGHERFDIDYTLGEIRPDIIIDPQYIPGMLRDERLRREFRREPAFSRNLVLLRRELSLNPPDE